MPAPTLIGLTHPGSPAVSSSANFVDVGFSQTAFWVATVLCICCMLRRALTFRSTVQSSFLGLVPKQASFAVAPDPKGAWLSRIATERVWRDTWIQQFKSSTQAYTDEELEAIARGEALLGLLEHNRNDGPSDNATKNVEYQGHRGCLVSTVETLIRSAAPLDLVAHLLHHDAQQSKDKHAADVRDFGTWAAPMHSQVLEDVNDHHRVVKEEFPVPGRGKMTFVFSLLAKMVASEGDLVSYVLVFAPRVHRQQAAHGPSTPSGSEHGTLHKCFRFTVVGPDVTKLEYVCLLDLKRKLSRWSERRSRRVIESHLMSAPRNLRVYFQRLRPLDVCSAEDGRLVGSLLMDATLLSEGSANKVVGDFFIRTAMLRDTPFPHFCDMLASAVESRSRVSLSSVKASVLAAVGNAGANQNGVPNSYIQVETKLDPSLLNEHEARLIGRAFGEAVAANKMPCLAVVDLMNTYPTLSHLAERYEWFRPMIEAITVRLMVSSFKTQLRVAFYGFLSLSDVFSDLYMTVTFFMIGQHRTGGAILALVLLSMSSQLMVVFFRNKHRERRAILKEVLISLSFFKPVVDARRLACAHEVDGAPYAPLWPHLTHPSSVHATSPHSPPVVDP